MHDYVSRLNDPLCSIEKLLRSFTRNHNACFVLCNAGTKVSDREGISAAGVDAQSRRLTPALDAEALIAGKTISADSLPVSPRGIVSPVVITRACLQLLEMDQQVVDCGSFYQPKVDFEHLSNQVANCASTGAALPEEHVRKLFSSGLALGEKMASTRSHLMLAECVPGGTTTALAILTALGYKVQGLLSSSLPSCNHTQRDALVEAGLVRCRYTTAEMQADPLLAISAMGDPMQAVVAGIACSASSTIPVFLAGGSQMLAVWALIKSLKMADNNKVMVLSTKWVAHDPGAGVYRLAKMLHAPFAVACPDFTRSSKPGLRAYEEGNVKEGVGAGASMCLAHTAGFTPETILTAIDACYDEFTLERRRLAGT